ncbi:HLA class II histocompatibility antigen gamma chain isoform X2 [Pseudophryne corroboree]|uniref:HLA class II histocompatibility antigen gamma chain isoform X2 n=1 Tax=Pseudophryne corroboree TaxID=495146 RepID=UPI00308187C1
MAEETQNLVPNGMSGESVVEVGNGNARTCNKRSLVTALSVFVGILIVGQAVTVYFVTQQQSKISTLLETTNKMKLDAMIKNLPGSPPDKNKRKMPLVAFSMPLLSDDDTHTMRNLEYAARASNHIEDAAKYSLLMGNPLRKYPSFNGTILDNLRKLRKTLGEEEWMAFDSWMQQWYLFYLVQNTKTPGTPSVNKAVATGDSGLLTSPERNLPPAQLARSGHLVFGSSSHSADSLFNINDETPSGAPVLTPCQEKASSPVKLGAYVPQCDEDGEYTPMQCWRGTGYCWCVYNNGTEVPETRSRAKLDCSDFLEPTVNYEDFFEANQTHLSKEDL